MRIESVHWMLAIIVLIGGTSAIHAGQDDFDITYYGINLRIDPAAETIEGSVTVRAVSAASSLSQLVLDFSTALTVTGVEESAVGFEHANDMLTIDLDQGYPTGQEVAVVVNYNGHPESITGLGMVFGQWEGAPTIHTISCPYHAYLWMPCKDHPGDKADSVDMTITVPENLVAASNGKLLGVVDNGDGTKTYSWHEGHPISTYLMCLTIGEYVTIEDVYVSPLGGQMALCHYVYPSDLAHATEDFNVVPQAIDVFTEWYGEYAFIDEKYGMAECNMVYAGMEHQNMVTIHPAYITGNHDNDDLLVHELSHMWWGDCVTVDSWHHCWLNEGFASYSEALYHEAIAGEKDYHEYMNNVQNALGFRDPIYRSDLSEPFDIFDSVVYDKGAWVVHMLRHLVGDSLFRDILREYRARHEYANATTEDFHDVCEEVSGQELDWFFQEWIYEAWHPEYFYGYTITDRGAGYDPRYHVQMFIDQEQSEGPIFHMPLDVTEYHDGVVTTTPLMIDGLDERYEVVDWHTNTRPDSIVLDADDWVLKEASCTIQPQIDYRGHDIVAESGNQNGRPDPGETVTLTLSLGNRGVDASRVTVQLQSPYAGVMMLTDTASVAFVAHRDTATCGPFSFVVSDTAAPQLADIVAYVTAEPGYAASDTFLIGLGQASILLVDDDGGAVYEDYYLQPLVALSEYAEHWDVASAGVPSHLASYSTVIWFTGDDSTGTLTPEEQTALASYLDAGGHLLISGQNIGFDLVEQGTGQDSIFYADYLKAALVEHTTPDYMTMGVPGDPIGGGMFVYLQGAFGAGNQTSPSVISPVDPTVSVLRYLPSQGTAATRYEDSNTGARVVYLAFGFEGIGGPFGDTATKFLRRMLDWLSVPSAVEAGSSDGWLPDEFRLSSTYPNPFNSATSVVFDLPSTEFVELCVVNARGQKIRTLVREERAGGRYRETWDGRDDTEQVVATGVYYIQLEAGAFRDTSKTVFLR